MKLSRLPFAMLAWLVFACTSYAEVTIRFVASADSGKQNVCVEGIAKDDFQALRSMSTDRLVEFFKLTVEGRAGASELPSVLGQAVLEDNRLIFLPRFPFHPGQVYRGEYRSPVTREATWKSLTFPQALPNEPTRILAIYPSITKLPRNVLRFYLHFSGPMQQGDVYRHLQLTKSDGTRLNGPFLEVAEELWDRTGARLTLLFDPGRVKQGLVPREEDGAIFEIGESYRLTVQSTWLDAQGQALASIATKEFSIGNDDFDQPDPRKWQIHPPTRLESTRSDLRNQSTTGDLQSALHVDVPEPLDQALFRRCLKVFNPKKELMEGETETSNEEKRWTFRPRSTWQAGTYTLEIDDILEDVAGNSIARPFEVDTSKAEQPSAPLKTLHFTIP
jgi:hypothetical protein